MWDEIQDMSGEIFDIDIDDRDMMPPDMQEDIEHEDPLNPNPYVQNLIDMGYDEQDVKVCSTMFQKKTFPCVIHGRKFETEKQYHEELHEFMNGM